MADEHIAAIQTLGYTGDEARFLYIVATHAGYFVPHQFISFREPAGASARKCLPRSFITRTCDLAGVPTYSRCLSSHSPGRYIAY